MSLKTSLVLPLILLNLVQHWLRYYRSIDRHLRFFWLSKQSLLQSKQRWKQLRGFAPTHLSRPNVFQTHIFLPKMLLYIKHTLNVYYHSIGINTLITITIHIYYFTISRDRLFINLSMSTIISLFITSKNSITKILRILNIKFSKPRSATDLKLSQIIAIIDKHPKACYIHLSFSTY